MTEAEWLACEDPQAMLDFLEGDRLTERSLRLFACATCRRVQDRFHDDRIMEAVEVAERYADGLATVSDLERADQALLDVPGLLDDVRDLDRRADWHGKVRKCAVCAADRALDVAHWRNHLRLAAPEAAAIRYNEGAGDAPALKKERAAQAAVIRCIFGGLSRPSVESSRMTPLVALLARSAYEERDLPRGELEPARLAVLSDALEEAGCTDDALLAHLRSPGPHVRGCWALDLILGKR